MASVVSHAFIEMRGLLHPTCLVSDACRSVEILDANMHAATIRLEVLSLAEAGLSMHQIRHFKRQLRFVSSCDCSKRGHTLHTVLLWRQDTPQFRSEAVLITAVVRERLSSQGRRAARVVVELPQIIEDLFSGQIAVSEWPLSHTDDFFAFLK